MGDDDGQLVTSDTLNALDRRHRVSWDAFDAQDLVAYMDFFAPELVWTGIDGRTIDFATLRQQVRGQFERGIKRTATTYEREAVSLDGEQVIETLTQTSDVTLNAFGVLRRDIALQRQGSYRWSQQSGTWRVAEARVTSETLKTKRWRLAWFGQP